MLDNLAIIMVSHKRIQAKGGIESMIKLFIEKFSSRNIPVCLVYRELFRIVDVRKVEPQEKRDEIENRRTINSDTPIKIIYAPEILFLFANIIFSFMAAFKILCLNKDYKKKGRFVIIHAMDTVYDGLAAFLVSKLVNVPFVAHTHGVRAYFMQITSKSRIVKTIDFLVETLVVRGCSVLISVNQDAADFWIRYGVSKDKIKIIPVSIETKLFAPSYATRVALRSDLKIDVNTTVFGYIGRLSLEKNVLRLVEAFYKANIDAKLLIIGDGPLMFMLKSYIQSKKMENKVILTGFRNDIHRMINVIDVLVLPSFIEGLPTVILEAFSNGKPVIASSISAIQEVVSHGREGFLFNPLNVNQLEEAMVRLHKDLKLRAILAQNAREKAKLYDAERIFGRILKVYDEQVRCKAE